MLLIATILFFLFFPGLHANFININGSVIFNERENISRKAFSPRTNVLSFYRIEIPNGFDCTIMNRTANGEVVGRREYRIVVTSTSAYFGLFLNWLYYYNRLCPIADFIFFVCFDKYIEKRLLKYGFECGFVHYLPSKGAHQRLWLIRGIVVKKLLIIGYDVILTDSDAIWLQNPFPFLNQFPSSDIIASRASFPEEVYERLGATLCMGFVYFQTNPAVITLWTSIVDEMVKNKQPDDQRTLNIFMMRQGLHFTRKLNYRKNYVDDTGSFRYEKYSYNLTFLSQNRFRRVCELNHGRLIYSSVVVHCSSSAKEMSLKQLGIANLGLWRLIDRWSSAEPENKNMQQWLKEIASPLNSINSNSSMTIKINS
jgi:hypothetical protein